MYWVKLAAFGLVAVLALAATATAADELQLRSGDRLTGDVVALHDGKLTFKTSFGELTIPWSEVAALRLDGPMLVTVTGAGPRMTTLEGIALADVTALACPPPRLVLGGGASLGWLATGGNTDINSLHLDGEITARRPDDRFTSGVAVNRAEDGGRQTARNATVTFNYDRFLSERLFANGNAIFTNDTFATSICAARSAAASATRCGSRREGRSRSRAGSVTFTRTLLTHRPTRMRRHARPCGSPRSLSESRSKCSTTTTAILA